MMERCLEEGEGRTTYVGQVVGSRIWRGSSCCDPSLLRLSHANKLVGKKYRHAYFFVVVLALCKRIHKKKKSAGGCGLDPEKRKRNI